MDPRRLVVACAAVISLAAGTACSPTIQATRAVDDAERVATLNRYSAHDRDLGVTFLYFILPIPWRVDHASVVTSVDDEPFPFPADFYASSGEAEALIGAATAASSWNRTLAGDPTKLLVAPGRHTIQGKYTRWYTLSGCAAGYLGGAVCAGPGDLPLVTFTAGFDAEVGHEYSIFAYSPELDGSGLRVWVEDLTTGRVVAGEPP